MQTLMKNCSVSAESLFLPWSLRGAVIRATNSRMGNEQLGHSSAVYARVHPGRRSTSSCAERTVRIGVDLHFRVLPLDQGVEAVPVRGEQGLDAICAHVRDDDVTNLVGEVSKGAGLFNLLALETIVAGRLNVGDRQN